MENKKDYILSLLQSSSLFCGLNATQLENLAQKTAYKIYKPGHILIEEELMSQRIIYILEGLVKVYKTTPDGKEILLAIEKDHNYLGVMDLGEKPGSATVETLQTTKALIFYKKDLLALLDQHPILWERLYRITLAKLNAMKKLYSIRFGNDLYQRTYLLLTHLANASVNNVVTLSQESLATLIGATRPRVTETLHRLQKEGLIHLSSKKITVL